VLARTKQENYEHKLKLEEKIKNLMSDNAEKDEQVGRLDD